jgi:hypothetical protein
MGANEQPSVLLSWLSILKLYMAIFLLVLPDGYLEHFLQCQFKSGEEMAAM